MYPLLVIPTYNEADNLAPLVEEILRRVPRLRVLIADDSSPDGTGEIADRLAGEHPNRVRVLHRSAKDGMARAYLEAFSVALRDPEVDRIAQMDADFSHRPIDLGDLVAKSEEPGADVVLGSRYVRGGGTLNWSALRQTISRLANLYARTVLRLPVRDLTGGFKVFRREVLEAIPLSEIKTRGYVFQIEMTYRAVLLGHRVVEVPIVFEERRAGKSKFHSGIVFEAVFKVLWLRRLHRFAAKAKKSR
jgi:dolichol-phosphate mannosyltransferase